MDPLAIVRRRLAAQGLVGPGFASPAEVVARLGGVQAQEYAEACWSLGQRVRGSLERDVEAALERGDILRTHVLRPTWHFVTPADIRWLLRLTGPRVEAANRYWYGRLGLDADVLAAGLDVVGDLLGDGQARTRRELAGALAVAGIEAAGPRLGYLCMHAELAGLIGSGPRRGRQQTYVLLAHRAPPSPLDDLDGEEARAELVRRYFTSHGPATIRDFTNWSSLTVADTRAGLARVGDDLRRDEDESGRAWYSSPAEASPSVSGSTGAHLIPMYDETVMYRDVRVVLAAEPPGPGLLNRPIVLDGRTVGSWSRTLAGRAATLEATLFRPLTTAEEAVLQAAVERFGRFLERPIELRTHRATA